MHTSISMLWLMIYFTVVEEYFNKCALTTQFQKNRLLLNEYQEYEYWLCVGKILKMYCYHENNDCSFFMNEYINQCSSTLDIPRNVLLRQFFLWNPSGGGGGPVFEVKIFFLINTLENYILQHFNNTQTKKDFYIIQKKISPSKFYFLCEIWIFVIFRCNSFIKWNKKKMVNKPIVQRIQKRLRNFRKISVRLKGNIVSKVLILFVFIIFI